MNKTGQQNSSAAAQQRNSFKGNYFHSLTTALLLCCTAALLLLIGCGAKHPILSDAHQSAVKFNQRAESSFKNGDYENALRLYSEALKINRSIENIDGIAINIINMAATYRKLDDKDNAHKQIDEILNASPIAYNPIHLS